MKRKRILTQFGLYFIMLMFLIVAGCSDDDDDDNAPQNQQELFITISGTVTTAGGTPVEGVAISALLRLEILNLNVFEGSFSSDRYSLVMTREDGTYSFSLPAALIENYTIVLTPAKKGYTFNPVNRAIQVGLVDIPNQNFTATAVSLFSQADLQGVWRINMLRAGANNQIMRARVQIPAANNGAATCLAYEDSDGTVGCPLDFELIFTMDADGIITLGGAYAPEAGNHMTMNSSKNLMAGTGTSGASYQLMVVQKDDIDPAIATGVTTHYNPLDVQSKSFVFHSLTAGATNEWRYGFGATDPAGVIAMNSEANSAGSTATNLVGTLAVDANGVVTDTSASLLGFQGFLSDDEKTIVGTYLDDIANPTEFNLIVFQFPTGQPIDTMTGSSVNHLLAVGAAPAPFWAYHDINVERFEVNFLRDILNLTFGVNLMLSYNWESSNSMSSIEKLLLTGLEILDITATGEATIETLGLLGSSVTSFHGQLAYDGSFMVGVETVQLSPFNTAPTAATGTYTYTVTYNAPAATTPPNPTFQTVNSPATSVGSLPTAPTLTGSTFAGWWTGAGCGGTEFIANTPVVANITVEACWQPLVYTVTYNSQGGNNVGAQHVFAPATTVAALPTNPTRTGYVFVEWNTEADGSGTAFDATTTVNANITVYAIWARDGFYALDVITH
ncbi:MAG: InlB B-repeat-containing protein [Syntrophaceae bacterium]|nr:InlB B-repeat-containing protein [Syntrophaceae bacterium]